MSGDQVPGGTAGTLADELAPLHAQMWRAPSAHNTQPWLLEAVGNDEVELRWDPARTLPVADPTMRDLFLSLGAFVEQSLTVAGAAGTAIDFEPGVDVAQRRVGRFVRAVAGAGAGHVSDTVATNVNDTTAQQAVARSCNRGAYEPGSLGDDVVEQLTALAARAGCRLVATQTEPLAQLLVDADRHMFGDVPTTRELRSWLRLSPRGANFTRDGLTYTALDMSRGEAMALGAITGPAYPLLKALGVGKALASASKPLLRYDGTVLCLVGPATSDPVGTPARHEQEIAAGRELLRTWLALQAGGHSVHPLSQIIDAPTTYAALHAHLQLTDADRVLAIFRVGVPTQPTVPTHRLH